MNQDNNLLRALYASDSEDDEAVAVLNRIRRGDFNAIQFDQGDARPALRMIPDEWNDDAVQWEEGHDEDAPPIAAACYDGSRLLESKCYHLPDQFRGNLQAFPDSQHGAKDMTRRLLAS